MTTVWNWNWLRVPRCTQNCRVHCRKDHRPKRHLIGAQRIAPRASADPDHMMNHNADNSSEILIRAMTKRLGSEVARVLETVLECDALRPFQSEPHCSSRARFWIPHVPHVPKVLSTFEDNSWQNVCRLVVLVKSTKS